MTPEEMTSAELAKYLEDCACDRDFASKNVLTNIDIMPEPRQKISDGYARQAAAIREAAKRLEAMPDAGAELILKERQRCADLLLPLYVKAKPGPEKAAYIFARNVILRGRELTDKEKIENLRASLNDEDAPHPAPTAALPLAPQGEE